MLQIMSPHHAIDPDVVTECSSTPTDLTYVHCLTAKSDPPDFYRSKYFFLDIHILGNVA